jgi:hypothetical protein
MYTMLRYSIPKCFSLRYVQLECRALWYRDHHMNNCNKTSYIYIYFVTRSSYLFISLSEMISLARTAKLQPDKRWP